VGTGSARAEVTADRADPGRRRGVAPWFLPLVACAVLTQTTLNLARPLMSYRVIALGGDALAVGLVTATFAGLPLLVAMRLGRVTDRRDRLAPLLVLGTSLFVVAPVLLSLAGDVLSLAVAGAVLGLGQLVLLIAAQATIARWSPEPQMDRAFGWFTAAVSVGQLLGPLAGGLLLGSATGEALVAASRRSFWLAAAVSVLAVPLAGLVAARTPRRPLLPAPPADRGGRSLPFLLRCRRVPTWLFASLAVLGAVDVLTAYLPVVAEHRGIAPSVVGVLLALRAAATICSRLLLDRLLTRWRREPLVLASAAGSAVALAVVPLPGAGVAVMAAALVLAGFLLGIGQPLTMGLVVLAVPDDARSRGLALRLMANRVGQVVVPGLAGVVAGPGGGGALWLACGVLAAAALATRRAAPAG
jgi:MFS family permease